MELEDVAKEVMGAIAGLSHHIETLDKKIDVSSVTVRELKQSLNELTTKVVKMNTYFNAEIKKVEKDLHNTVMNCQKDFLNKLDEKYFDEYKLELRLAKHRDLVKAEVTDEFRKYVYVFGALIAILYSAYVFVTGKEPTLAHFPEINHEHKINSK